VAEQTDDPGSLLNWYRDLLDLRQQREELRRGHQRILCDDDGPMLCLLREADGARSLLLANLSDAPATVALGDPVHGPWPDPLAGGQAQPERLVREPMQVRLLRPPGEPRTQPVGAHHRTRAAPPAMPLLERPL